MCGVGLWFFWSYLMWKRLLLFSSSLSSMWTGGSTTIWFHGTKTVLVSGLNGERWNWRVTAPPPLTNTSNLNKQEIYETFYIEQNFWFWYLRKKLLLLTNYNILVFLKTHHPPCRVSVNPNLLSLSTETRIPTIPRPCGVTTWPLITATRLLTYYRHLRIPL